MKAIKSLQWVVRSILSVCLTGQLTTASAQVTATPPDGYTLIQEDSLKDENKFFAVQRTYRTSEGKLVACFYIDEKNFAWGAAYTRPDKYTGEEKLFPTFYTSEHPLSSFVRVSGSDTIVYYNKTLYFFGKGRITVACTDDWTQNDMGQTSAHTRLFMSPKYDQFFFTSTYRQLRHDSSPSEYAKFRMLLNGRWVPCCSENYFKALVPGYTGGGKNIFAADKENNSFWVLSWIEYYKHHDIKQVTGLTYKKITLPSKTTVGIYLPLGYNRKITGSEENGKIAVVKFEGNDSIKLSTFANEIMECKITSSDGIYTVKDGALNLKYNQASERIKRVYNGSYWIDRKISIPVNSTYTVPNWDHSNFTTFWKYNISDFALNLIDRADYVYGPDTKPIFLKGEWARQQEYIKEQLAEKERLQNERAAEIKRKQTVIYNKYCQKYGKKYVDAAMNGRILFGAPIKMVQDMFICQQTLSNLYTVIVDTPTYNFEEGTLTCRGRAPRRNSPRASIQIKNNIVVGIRKNM